MYVISNEFKEICKSNVKSYKEGKIYILEDNTNITGNDYLKTFEIEDHCYVDDTFIGTTVSKKITVEILNPNNEFNLENKTIKVYTGAEINGEIE